MTDKNYMKRRFKCRCYQKDNTVKIYDGSEILFDVSYRDFDDAFYLGRKLQSVIMGLNELHEENERLKQNIDELLSVDIEEELEKENEQLKEQIADLETSFDICKHYKETYGDEIVHIKHTIKTMMETERTELGRSVLKQLWEQLQ